jgi:dipeptidyl aminopeptidase/acylaminoacyl peptidase
MKAAMVEVELVTFEDAMHGFKGADAEKAEKAMLDFFNKHLK